MTANDTTTQEGKNATTAEEKTIAELEAEILELYETSVIDTLDPDTIARNLEKDDEDIQWLLEDLVRRGELETTPVLYQRVRDESIADIGQMILNYLDEPGLNAIDAWTAAFAIRRPLDKVRSALDSLEGKGELRRQPGIWFRED